MQATGIGPDHSAIVRLFDIGCNGVMLSRTLGLGCARLNTLHDFVRTPSFSEPAPLSARPQESRAKESRNKK